MRIQCCMDNIAVLDHCCRFRICSCLHEQSLGPSFTLYCFAYTSFWFLEWNLKWFVVVNPLNKKVLQTVTLETSKKIQENVGYGWIPKVSIFMKIGLFSFSRPFFEIFRSIFLLRCLTWFWIRLRVNFITI